MTVKINEYLEYLKKSKIPHKSRYHQEDFYTHCICMVHNVIKTCPDDTILTIGSLFHDIGKIKTVKIRPGKGATFYNHELETDDIHQFIDCSKDFLEDIKKVINLHMLPFKMRGPSPWKEEALQIWDDCDLLTRNRISTMNIADIAATFVDISTIPSKMELDNMEKEVINYFKTLA